MCTSDTPDPPTLGYTTHQLGDASTIITLKTSATNYLFDRDGDAAGARILGSTACCTTEYNLFIVGAVHPKPPS